ncbi:S8 family serine peptidase [Natrinema salsiterrestre]|uniref:S8 family serine peptidase n=1 Tax=Natrinema salsiterrestre TaxID=2950540 RepID=A0A9Q4KZS5_9EURY|nr:S8 family serine peptidase [Natrinema salsiterrestre]MDF9747250.1 S8 family serine peptidase [Natrinema salsiterrestre]
MATGSLTDADSGADGESLTVSDVQTQSGDDVRIESELEQSAASTDTVEVFVRMDAEASQFATATDAESATALKREAEATQRGLETYADDVDGVEIVTEFWLTNAALVEVDTTQVDLEELARIDGVTELHPNYEVELVEPDANDGAANDSQVTYGLEQVNAPEVWEEFDATGEGVSVAVVDTGLAASHEQFADRDEVRDNWAEFDFDGSEIESEPYDRNGHGTHVAGTILGGEADGQRIGVAPDAELIPIGVFPGMPERQSTTLAAIVAGLQEAVEQDADVANFSLGGGGFAAIYVDVIRNAQTAGTLVVSSSGNDGPGSEGTPANVYDSLAIGATNSDEQVAEFSTGATVNTDADWGPVAPNDWPESYATPDVSAPGVDVRSSYLGGNDTYAELSGTSMAAPHTSGVAALLAAQGVEDPYEMKALLEETATKPAPDEIGQRVGAEAREVSDAQYENLYDDGERDVRYGYGIVDAYAASAALANESRIEGTVVDGDGDPITDRSEGLPDGSGPTVTIDDADRSQYAGDGSFAFDVTNGQHDVTVSDAFGYAETTETIDASEPVERDIVLEEQFALELVRGQPRELEAGSTAEVAVDVAHLEELTVELANESTVDESNVTVDLAGVESDVLGDTVAFDEPLTATPATLEITVDGANAGERIALEHTFTGSDGTTETVTTGPTTVVTEVSETAPLRIVETDIVEEALASEQIAPGPVVVENPDDEVTQNGTVVWKTPIGDFSSEEYELEPGETATYNRTLSFGDGSPAPWSYIAGTGETVDHRFVLVNETLSPIQEERFTTDIVGGELNGTVTDADTGEPLPGIEVTATNGDAEFSTLTDSSGAYGIVVDSPGEWTVTADAASYGPTSATVRFDDDLDPIERNLTVGSDPTFELSMEGGKTYSVGLPGPVEGGTVGDVVPEETNATVLTYNETTNRWVQPSPDDELEPLDALLVTPFEDTTVTVEFAGTPGTGDGVTDPREIESGWNFVAPAAYDDPESAFEHDSDATLGVFRIQRAPDSKMVPESGFGGVGIFEEAHNAVNPFTGYFVFASADAELETTVDEGTTLGSAYEALEIDAERRTGTVERSVDGAPVANATVRVPGTSVSTTTSADGSFTLPALPTDVDQEVTVTADGFENRTVRLDESETVELEQTVFFDVTDLAVNETSLGAGEEYTVEYELENRGTERASDIVEIEFGPGLDDGQRARLSEDVVAINSTVVELAPGDTTTLEIRSEVIDEQVTGESQIGVFTPDDREVVNVTVTDESATSSETAAGASDRSASLRPIAA